MSIEANAPESLRKPWIPPIGTWTKSPGSHSRQAVPSKIVIRPTST